MRGLMRGAGPLTKFVNAPTGLSKQQNTSRTRPAATGCGRANLPRFCREDQLAARTDVDGKGTTRGHGEGNSEKAILPTRKLAWVRDRDVRNGPLTTLACVKLPIRIQDVLPASDTALEQSLDPGGPRRTTSLYPSLDVLAYLTERRSAQVRITLHLGQILFLLCPEALLSDSCTGCTLFFRQ